ncbi:MULTISPECIES: MFS transporter [unclassified Phenylobacterium]|uniref:spinster family MFS transporter n=1 Tax=unclassified Phenylobacterium TaxID=2640670 RepID=UPI00083A1969|nr:MULTISPECIES: MFS transporter [unclassified Phenylobacterium]
MTEAVSPDATPAAKPALPDDSATPFSVGYTRYVMWLLLGIYIINFLDRQVLNILIEDIKLELHLTDTQMGLLGGLAFAIFYTVLGIPIARLAERKNRAVIIGSSVAVWSGFTALCATAGNFWQLLLYRVGVGVGEAGCTPPAHSLIVDYVPKEKRASALAFYSMGTPIGTLVGLIMGGLVADAYGWRAAFLVAGVPGLVFAALAFFTLKEPRARLARHAAQVKAASATFGETMRYLATKRTFWFIALAAAVKAFIGYGHAPFTASFFFRNHAEEVSRLATLFGDIFGFDLQSRGFVGLALGIMSGTAGTIGALVGGMIADKFGKNDLRAYMITPAVASLVTIPVYIAAVTVGSATLAFCLLAVNAFLATLWYGPVYGTGQSVVPPHMRATAAAILLFIINLIGLGLGPVAVGAVSDFSANMMLADAGLSVGACKAAVGAAKATCASAVGEGVRWALIASTMFGLIAFACFWLARRTIREDTVS